MSNEIIGKLLVNNLSISGNFTLNDKSAPRFALITFQLTGDIEMSNSHFDVMVNLPFITITDDLEGTSILYGNQIGKSIVNNVSINFRGML